MNGWYFTRIVFLMDGQQFNTVWLNSPWGKVSLESVLLGTLLFFVLAGLLQRVMQNREFRKFQQKLEENSSFQLKFEAAQRKIREQHREMQLLKKKLHRKGGGEERLEELEDLSEGVDTERKIPASRAAGEVAEKVEGKAAKKAQVTARPLADQIALIARELSPDKLKPDKEEQIYRVMETLFSRKNDQKKGATAMSEKQQNKSVVKEIGIFRLFIIGTLISILTNMLAETWKRVRYRFDEETPPDQEKS